jgi:uncharacterized protein YuzE
MRQEIFDDRAVLIFSDDKVEDVDNRSDLGVTIGYGTDRKIVRLEFVNPPRRAGTNQILIVERYDPVADALDVELDEGSWHDTEETPEGFLIDYDSEHRVVALEFLGASKLFPQAALARLSHAA